MSDPLDPSARDKRETVFADPTRPADPGNFSWPDDPYSPDHYLVPEEDARVVHQERLFSRRVLFGWAFATLIVVFAITVILPMVVPIVRDSVMTSVMARMKQQGMIHTDAGAPVVPVIPATPEIPAIPPVPEVPAVPAIAGEPAEQAPHASAATGATPPKAPTTHAKKSAPAGTDRR